MSKSELNLSSFDVDQLQQIQEDAQKLIVEKQRQRLHDAYREFEQIAERCDSSVEEILAAGEVVAKQRNIKYRDPNNPNNAWAGRGRKPAWLTDALESGESLESFAV